MYPIEKKGWKKEDDTWYTTKAIGKNEIGKFMSKISNRLGLSDRYTNHAIRRSTISVLSAAGVPTRSIMRVTNHKAESSIKHYDRDNTTEQKRHISKILSNVTQKRTSTATYSKRDLGWESDDEEEVRAPPQKTRKTSVPPTTPSSPSSPQVQLPLSPITINNTNTMATHPEEAHQASRPTSTHPTPTGTAQAQYQFLYKYKYKYQYPQN